MSLPVYVVNFDEFIDGLGDNIKINIGTIQLDAKNFEELFDKYFPELISLLRLIYENTKPPEGTTKKKGFKKTFKTTESDHEFIFEVSSPIMLTGVSVAQNKITENDFWNLKIINSNKAEITLFDRIYTKDTLNHKNLNVYFPVPAGYTIKIEYCNVSHTNKTVWADLEMLGVEEQVFTTGTIIVNHLATLKDGDIAVLESETIENLEFKNHEFKAKTFEGFLLKDSDAKQAKISKEHPTRVIEFIYIMKDIEITHSFDYKVTLDWNDKWVDLDFIAALNHDERKILSFKEPVVKTGFGQLQIDIEEKGKEVFTIEGLKSNNISIFITNFNGREMSENPIFSIENSKGNEIFKEDIPKNLLNMDSTRLVYVGDFIPPDNFKKLMIPWNKIC